MKLTRCQQKVLREIAEGKALKEIAADSHRSEKTIQFHYPQLRRKLNLSGVALLTQFATQAQNRSLENMIIRQQKFKTN